ncbi:MAG: ABC transporter substrate-binding protein [Hyphomicrobiaceae bacterium]|nr:ABC transporter substrate-binding protein [Hyphomicrobiaceae bacterium]
MPQLDRRQFLAGSTAALAVALLPTTSANAQAAASHGLSAFGDLKYPAGFTRFDYVNPDAPKGGVLSRTVSSWMTNQNPTTFNSLNVWILKGDGAAGVERTFATLMVRAEDEPDAVYGLAAETVEVSPDRLTYRFRLRPGIVFHDGSPITAEDVAWSFMTLKQKGHPTIAATIADMVAAEADGTDVVVVRFAPERSRDIHLAVAGLPIFSKAWYAGRDFAASTLEPPLGSGPYRIGSFEQGRFIELIRVANWWGKDLPVSVGHHNFDVLRIDFYRDHNVSFEAFTAGNYLFREEFSSRIWSTQYNFPALADGRVRREVIEDHTPSGAQGWFINLRRPKFADRRIREALSYAFDFEAVNATVMYGLRQRTHSFFQNSDMMAEGLPSPEELALLEPHRGRLDPDVFGKPWSPPVSDGSGSDRRLLREADRLFREAGLTRKDGKLVLPTGEPFTIEFLDDGPTLEPHTSGFIQNLARLGVSATMRHVDAAQYRARVEDFDFDLTSNRFALGATPGEAAKLYWNSAAARTPGSRNLSGISDPVVDALVDRMLRAATRAELTTVCRALDRVLRAGRYWVPHWHTPANWFAYWDVYAHPAAKARYARGIETWWLDPAKAARLGKGLRG